jgi:hypothetical protein
MKRSVIVPLVLAALYGCADNMPTQPMPGAVGLDPLLGAFPGSNGRIAFVGLVGITTMNSAGGDLQQLAPAGSAGPAWSADGSKLAYYAFVDVQPGDMHHTEIFVVNADGTGRQQLTFTTALGGPAFPTWSPDGSKIAFQNDSDRRIYVMNSDGTGVTPLTAGPDFTPSWSPDGSKIVFASLRDGVAEIYVMNADGTGQTRLTNNDRPEFDPSWSPNGSTILYSRNDATNGDWPDLYVMNANGASQTNLTNTPNLAETNSVWSPDGSKILFIQNDDVNSEVYVMNADGTSRVNLSNSPDAFESHLDWQPLPGDPPVCVLGPTVYTRAQGAPNRIVQNFTATPGSYSVDLDDLASSGADAVVMLNGVVIMEGRGTTGEVGPRHHTVPVTLLANNVLDIQMRGKKGSKLQVTICSTSGSACYPNLPAPTLSLQSSTVNGTMVEFQLDVPNYAQFPAALFEPAPDLDACGANTSAARTWVDIYDGNDNFIYGFCALYDGASLNDIWFSTPSDQRPAEVYIKLHDRRCNITYTSNKISIPTSQ